MIAYFGRSDIKMEPGRVIYRPSEGGVTSGKEEGRGSTEFSAPDEFDLLVDSQEMMPDDENCNIR